MSISTENSSSAPPPPASEQPRWQQRNLSPARGLFLLGAFAVVVVVIISYYDLLGHFLLETAHLGMEVVEELMDTAFEFLGMTPGTAQMVTAYVGLTILLVLFYLLLRKSIVWNRRLKETIQDYCDLYRHILHTWSRDIRSRLIQWWKELGWLAKIAAVLGTMLILIPLALGLAVGLGILATMML